MCRFAFKIIIVFLMLSFSIGCSEPGPVACPPLLQPGRNMTLEVRYEMRNGGVSTSTTKRRSSDGTTKVVKEEHYPYTEVLWGQVRLPMAVSQMPDSNNLRLAMTVESYESGVKGVSHGEKHEKKQGFKTSDPPNPKSENGQYVAGCDFSDHSESSEEITGI